MSQVKILFSSVRLVLTKLIMNGWIWSNSISNNSLAISIIIIIIIIINLYFYPKLILIFSILSQNNTQHTPSTLSLS